MHPETQIVITAAFAGFLLKTSLAFCICWATSRVVASPSGRFLVWFALLVGTGCYWLLLGVGLAHHGPMFSSLTTPAVPAQVVSMPSWRIEPSWALPLSFVWRGFGVLYLLILGYFLFARARNYMHVRWILRFAYEAPEEIETILRPIVNSLEIGSVRLLVLPGIYSPATFSWLRPTILLPPFCLQHDRTELSIIFRHELQHVRRRDFVLHTIASLCRALLFFHPAMWYAMRRLKLESELACDLAVVSDSPEQRATYAECLVRFARLKMAEEAGPWNLDFAGSSFQLKARVRSLLVETTRIPRWSLALRATLGLLLFAGFLKIVPSLFVVLSYEQHRLAQDMNQVLPVTGINVQQHERQKRGNHLSNTFPLGQGTADTGQFVTPDASASTQVETAAGIIPERRSDTSNEPGPTLKRRSASGEAMAQKPGQGTIIPISGESLSYSGGPSAQRRVLNTVITTMGDIGSTGHNDKDGH